MKKILGVMGSPRFKGNTHVLVSTILDAAKEAGAEADIALLGDLEIRECDGCHVCWEGKKCPKNDDMNSIYPKIIDSDVIVFGTPVYWYGPTALMKAFIDRLVYFNCPENRAKIRGKSAVLVIPFEEEDPDMSSILEQLFEKSLTYLEMKLIDKVIVPGVTLRGEVAEKKDLLKKCLKLGKRLAG